MVETKFPPPVQYKKIIVKKEKRKKIENNLEHRDAEKNCGRIN